MNTWTITCSLDNLTIRDARTFAAAIPAQDDHILQLRGRGYDLSYWWNKSNAQLVVHNLATDELMTFEDIAESINSDVPAVLLEYPLFETSPLNVTSIILQVESVSNL